jgi:hypothetical protein
MMILLLLFLQKQSLEVYWFLQSDTTTPHFYKHAAFDIDKQEQYHFEVSCSVAAHR